MATRASATDLQAVEGGASANTRVTAADLEVLRNTVAASANLRATAGNLQVLRTVASITSTLATGLNLQVLRSTNTGGAVYTWQWL